MRVLAAPDKFRGTLTALQACAAIARGVERTGGQCVSLPMSDGGEGMLDAFGGPNRVAVVVDALGRRVDAPWRLDPDGTAVLESSRSNGLDVVGGAGANDPVAASTRGVGALVAAALACGARRLVVGTGGSATTDGGLGMIDELARLGALDLARRIEIVVCCDVRTTFTAAATLFAAQKGADPGQVEMLSTRLDSIRALLRERFGIDPEAVVGSGAAGGLAGAFAALGARLDMGADVIASRLGLDEHLERADLVVTGEGRLDSTSLQGKVVGSVVETARRASAAALVVVGDRDETVRVSGANVVSLTHRYGAERARRETAGLVARVVEERLRQ